MKVLITGGAGFIGYHLSKYLAEEGHNLLLTDNLFRGELDEDFKRLISEKNIKFLNIDLTKRNEFKKIDKDFDFVYHLAAINGTRYFYEMPHEVLRVNLITLINLLEWIKDTTCRRLIWTSSSEVYAEAARELGIPIPTPEDIMLVVNNIKNPRISYAVSKIAGEVLVANYSKIYNLNANIIRPHNIYGPRMGYSHVIPEFIQRIFKNEKPFRIYGGDQTRSFCYIDDFIRGITLIAKLSKPNETYNIGNDKEEITIRELASIIFDLSGFHPKIEILPAPEGSVQRRCPNIAKARSIGYEPMIGLRKGLTETVNWYKKHGE